MCASSQDIELPLSFQKNKTGESLERNRERPHHTTHEHHHNMIQRTLDQCHGVTGSLPAMSHHNNGNNEMICSVPGSCCMYTAI